jgi:carboxymethylenebutenolidase
MNGDETLRARDGGRFAAYIAVPKRSPAPGLLLMQYISGVNRVMRGLADRFAAAGFLVACPDLFWRQEPNVQINNDPGRPDPAEQKRALELNIGFRDDTGILDLIATLDHLRAHPRCSGKTGALGYCLGGRLAYLMAARSDIDCSIGYYGVNIHGYLLESSAIRRPLMLHMAERDELCPADTRDRIVGALQSCPYATVHVYPGARHAFALEGGPNYDAAAAELANRRSLGFLRQHLGS